MFDQTTHLQSMHTYVLDVTMKVTGGTAPFERHYHVVSSGGEGSWEKSNTSAADGKEKAGVRLMRALIPDLDSRIREN